MMKKITMVLLTGSFCLLVSASNAYSQNAGRSFDNTPPRSGWAGLPAGTQLNRGILEAECMKDFAQKALRFYHAGIYAVSEYRIHDRSRTSQRYDEPFPVFLNEAERRFQFEILSYSRLRSTSFMDVSYRYGGSEEFPRPTRNTRIEFLNLRFREVPGRGMSCFTPELRQSPRHSLTRYEEGQGRAVLWRLWGSQGNVISDSVSAMAARVGLIGRNWGTDNPQAVVRLPLINRELPIIETQIEAKKSCFSELASLYVREHSTSDFELAHSTCHIEGAGEHN